MLSPSRPDDITIVGGGIAGLSLAWELAKRGRHVTVVERERIGGGASATATSYMEPRFGTGASRRLEWESLRRWPEWARGTEEASGLDLGLSHGQWRFAYAQDESRVRADMKKREALGWTVEWLDGAELRERAKDLSSEIVGAVRVADPAWVDGPKVCEALAVAIRGMGGRVLEREPVADLPLASTTVLANGPGATALAPDGAGVPPIRRVKGTTLFHPCPVALPQMLRHPDISIVPRPNGVVVGASKEEDATSLAPDPAVVETLHARAARALPVLSNVDPEPSSAWRAYVPDRALALGRSQTRRNLWWSLGHGGVGYLRAPLVATELAGAICGEEDALRFCAPFFQEA